MPAPPTIGSWPRSSAGPARSARSRCVLGPGSGRGHERCGVRRRAWPTGDAFTGRLGDTAVPRCTSVSDRGTCSSSWPTGRRASILFGREGALEEIDVGPFEPLLDERGILAGAEFPFAPPDRRRAARTPAPGRELVLARTLAPHRRAGTRRSLVGAYGQLEALRRHCVNLVRIRHGAEAQDEPYESGEGDPGVRARVAAHDVLSHGRRDARCRTRDRALLPRARSPCRGSGGVRVSVGACTAHVRTARCDQPNVKQNACAPRSRNSISNRLSPDRAVLPDHLIHPRVGEDAATVVADVAPVGGAGRLAVDRHPIRHGVPGAWSGP